MQARGGRRTREPPGAMAMRVQEEAHEGKGTCKWGLSGRREGKGVTTLPKVGGGDEPGQA